MAKKFRELPKDQALPGERSYADLLCFSVRYSSSRSSTSGPARVFGSKFGGRGISSLIERFPFAFQFSDASLQRFQVPSIRFDKGLVAHLAVTGNDACRAKRFDLINRVD